MSTSRAADDFAPWLVPVGAALAAVAYGIGWLALGMSGVVTGHGWTSARVTEWPQAIRTQAPTFITISAVLLVALATVVMLLWRRLPRRERQQSWATVRQIKKLIIRPGTPGRIALGYAHGKLLVAALRESSVLAVGATRSGKTTGLAVPLILEWPGAVVVCSSKTDLVNLTHWHRQSQGEVWTFDPMGVSGVPSDGWNPLAHVRSFTDALRVAEAFADASPAVQSEGSTAYWKPQAVALAGACFFAATLSDPPLDMGHVTQWFKRSTLPEGEGGQFVDALAILNGARDAGPEVGVALDNLWYVLTLEMRQRDSAVGTCRAMLEVYDDPRVVDASRNAVIDPATLLDGKARTLYLVATRQEQSRLAPLFTALLAFIDRELSDRAARNRIVHNGAAIGDESERVLFVLDEVAKLAPLKQLPDLASEIGGEGGALLTIVQDFAQLQAKYRDGWRTIVNNHPFRLALAGIGDVQTLKWFTDNAGREMVVEDGWSNDNNGRRSRSFSQRERTVLPEAQVRQLADMTGVCVALNMPPFKVKLRPWWDDEHLKSLVRPIRAREAWEDEYEGSLQLVSLPSDGQLGLEVASTESTQPDSVDSVRPAKAPRPSVADDVCGCSHVGRKHGGKTHRGRCSECDCARFTSKPRPRPAKVAPMTKPEPRTSDQASPRTSDQVSVPTLAQLMAAFARGKAEACGTTENAPLFYDGGFYVITDDNQVEAITAGPQVWALKQALNRMRTGRALAAEQRGEVERIGDDPSMPFHYDGNFYVRDTEGLHMVTDAKQLSACEAGLERIRQARKGSS